MTISKAIVKIFIVHDRMGVTPTETASQSNTAPVWTASSKGTMDETFLGVDAPSESDLVNGDFSTNWMI